jgi:hypothetical protein
MKIQPYSNDTITAAMTYLSSDALLLLVCDALARHEPFSAVRMGDGEKAILDYATGRADPAFLHDIQWQEEYGLIGADYHQVASGLMLASRGASVLCLNTAGLTKPNYAIAPYVAPRTLYGEGLFAHSWAYMGRVYDLMKYPGEIAVVCRESQYIARELAQKFRRPFISVEYGSWRDACEVRRLLGGQSIGLVLVAGGPSGKALCVDLAADKVVLDIGSAMKAFWATDSPRNGPSENP